MAWESCSSDIVVSYPEYSLGPVIKVSGKIAYRLLADLSSESNPLARIDVTYFHLSVKLDSSSSAGQTDLSAVAASKLLGSTYAAFNQDQYDLNQELDDNGNYVHAFAWPYSYDVKALSKPDTLQDMVRVANIAMYDSQPTDQSLPVFAIAALNSISSFSSENVSYSENGDSSSITTQAVLWGQAFSDLTKFSGSNSNGQAKVLITSNSIDVATSSLKVKSSGKVLKYSEESSYSDDQLEVASPYIDSQAFCSTSLSKSYMEQWGLLRYDPSAFEVDDEVYDPYIVKGYLVPFSWWSVLPSTGSATISRFASSEKEIKLEYEDFEIPEYPLPDPVKPIDDNTVFRLKKQYDSSGHLIVDQNGNPELKWVKCERMGQE